MQKRHSESTRGIKFSPHIIQCMERKFSCSLSKVCLWRTWKLSESTVLGQRIWDWKPNFYPLLLLTSKFYTLFTISGGKNKRKREKHKPKLLLNLSMQAASRAAVFIQHSLGRKIVLEQSKYNSILEVRLQNLLANFTVLTRYCHNDNLSTIAQDYIYISWK